MAAVPPPRELRRPAKRRLLFGERPELRRRIRPPLFVGLHQALTVVSEPVPGASTVVQVRNMGRHERLEDEMVEVDVPNPLVRTPSF